ncbi:Gfo/Idh/MocA family protein [Tannockella kyphosi]|uniref:Gfo/Idh/MocA family protein n=1 Tax=Tannockella kyphosi TaxID=2899121 RepID=UPI002013A3D1|nr:Gfo/Idh/MocA family oxidoreductase [Tannockella kyphosi]
MKLATVGTGSIVDKFLDATTKNENIEVIAMYSRKEETAKYLANKYSIPFIYTSLEDMLDNQEIEFIYIASPNSFHYPQALQALLAGKHVLCEKPFCSTTKELDHLRTIAKEKKLFLFEAITTIHLPNYLEMKKRLSSIGKIHMVECNFSKYSSRYKEFLNGDVPNVFNPVFSGGALADLNIYNLHFVINLFGKPTSCIYYPNLEYNGIDSSGVAILQYPNFQATCIASKTSNAYNFGQISGENGYLFIKGTSTCLELEVHTLESIETINLQTYSNKMVYELAVFENIYLTNDYARCYQLLDDSYDVLCIFETLRNQANLKYHHYL